MIPSPAAAQPAPHAPTTDTGLAGTCPDCGNPSFCGVPHGSGHDHSVEAHACTIRTLEAAGLPFPHAIGCTDEHDPWFCTHCYGCGEVLHTTDRDHRWCFEARP